MAQVIQRAPNGMAIRFQSHPPRGYWIMADPTPLKVADDKHKDWGKRLTSVTTVLNVLDKPALKWWGQGIGIVGVLELVRMGVLEITPSGFNVLDDKLMQQLLDDIDKDAKAGDEKLVREDQQIAKLLTYKKLTVNHVTRTAAKRGTTAHNAFETWANTGILPDPRAYPDEQRPYVEALRKFFDENKLTDVHTEVVVASPKYRFGGRYDFDGRINDGPHEVIDVKTAKDVYTTHFIQMEGYEGARVELGYKPTERRRVLHLGVDGEYKLVASEDVTKDKKPCVYDDFLAALRLSRVVDRLGGL